MDFGIRIVEKNPEIDFTINEDTQSIAVRVEDRVVLAKYAGTYLITPLVGAAQELQTADRVLTQNLIIEEIPYYETHNEYGTTVYIGE